MKSFESLIYTLFPEWLLNSTPWVSIWKEKRHEEFITLARFTYGLLIIGYPLHYFFVDSKLGLVSDQRWLLYRGGLTIISIVGFISTFTGLRDRPFISKFYFISTGLIIAYLQARSTTWYNGVPYFWGILFVVLFSFFSLISFIPAILYSILGFAIQWNLLIESGNNPALLLGAFSVGIIMVMIFKYNIKSEILSFIGGQEKLELQAKIIVSQHSLNEQIQAFLPKKIRERLNYQVVTNKLDIIHAMDEVLRQKNVKIAALFSDIRGFTQGSKKSDYLSSAAIPNMKMVTELAEKNNGISRQIGDLVFSYFDDDNFSRNIRDAFQAAAEILDMNERLNFAAPIDLKVIRYVLLDCGQALVGNIGGINSAREVTAMGSCINRLSRIDLVTKERKVADILGENAILMSEEYGLIVEKIFPSLTFSRIHLPDLELSIKDFPEVKQLIYFKLSEQSFQISFNNDSSRGAA